MTLHKNILILSLGLGFSTAPLAADGTPHSPDVKQDFHHHAPPSNSASAALKPPGGPVATAVVEEIIDGAGYSYLALRSPDGERFWLAGIQAEAKIKQGDTVRYVQNVIMENFTSRTLGRQFERIIFASSLEVVP